MADDDCLQSACFCCLAGGRRAEYDDTCPTVLHASEWDDDDVVVALEASGPSAGVKLRLADAHPGQLRPPWPGRGWPPAARAARDVFADRPPELELPGCCRVREELELELPELELPEPEPRELRPAPARPSGREDQGEAVQPDRVAYFRGGQIRIFVDVVDKVPTSLQDEIAMLTPQSMQTEVPPLGVHEMDHADFQAHTECGGDGGGVQREQHHGLQPAEKAGR